MTKKDSSGADKTDKAQMSIKQEKISTTEIEMKAVGATETDEPEVLISAKPSSQVDSDLPADKKRKPKFSIGSDKLQMKDAAGDEVEIKPTEVRGGGSWGSCAAAG